MFLFYFEKIGSTKKKFENFSLQESMLISTLSVTLARIQPTTQVPQRVTNFLRIRPIVKWNNSKIKKYNVVEYSQNFKPW